MSGDFVDGWPLDWEPPSPKAKQPPKRSGGRDHIEDGLLAGLAYLRELEVGLTGKKLAERLLQSDSRLIKAFAEKFPDLFEIFVHRYRIEAVSWDEKWDIDQSAGYQGILVIDTRDGSKRFIASGVSSGPELWQAYDETFNRGFAETQYREHESFFKQLLQDRLIGGDEPIKAIGHSLGFQLNVVLWANISEFVPEYDGLFSVKGFQGFTVNTDVDRNTNASVYRDLVDHLLFGVAHNDSRYDGVNLNRDRRSRIQNMTTFGRRRIQNVQSLEFRANLTGVVENVVVGGDIITDWFPTQGRVIEYNARQSANRRPHQLWFAIGSLNYRTNNDGQRGRPDFSALSSPDRVRFAAVQSDASAPIGSEAWRAAMEAIYDRHQLANQQEEEGFRTSGAEAATNLLASANGPSNAPHRLGLANTSIQFPFESAEAEAAATREALMAEVFDRMTGSPAEAQEPTPPIPTRVRPLDVSSTGTAVGQSSNHLVKQPTIPNGQLNDFVEPPVDRPRRSLVNADALFRCAGIESLFAPQPRGGYRGIDRDRRDAAIDRAIGIMGFKDPRDIGGFVFDLNDSEAQPRLRRQLASRLTKRFA